MYCVKDFVEDVMGQLQGLLPEGGVVHFKMPVKDAYYQENDLYNHTVVPSGMWNSCGTAGCDGLPASVIEFEAVCKN